MTALYNPAMDYPPLPSPARYFPLKNGRYEVTPGLRPLGTAFGNGEADARLFQIDRKFGRYRENKLRCRAERLEKYVVESDYSQRVASAVARFLVARFTEEYPGLFTWEAGSRTLDCRLTGERLTFDAKMGLIDSGGNTAVSPPYVSALDALCCQIPEDIAVVCTTPDGGDRIAALHLCSPSHWSAEDKIGKNFRATHAPVPGMERTNGAAASLVEAMVHRGPFVRFIWGVSAGTRLNHHPEPPPGATPETWKGCAFDVSAEGSPFYLRVERQGIWGLPEVGTAVFTIRISFIAGEEIRANRKERDALRAALLSMSPESSVYKGVDRCREALIAWLDQASPG